MRKILLIGISTFALGAACMASADQLTGRSETYKMLELFGDVLTAVDQQYVVPVDNKKLIQSAIDGMLTSLDPHSGYLDPADFGDMRDVTRGEYGGLGIQVTAEDGAVKVIAPMDGTPAARAGLQPGDFITAINGQSILGQPLTDAVKQMKGPVGTSVNLTIAREKTNPFTVKLTREVIDVKTVTSRLEGDYGYVRVSGFDEKTGELTTAALRELKVKDPHMKGVVLDLRSNPGGLVDAAVDVSSAFLDGGEVVSARGREARDIQRYNAKAGGDLVKGLPLAVLVNNGSASAAEIVAGALKDRQRAVIIGLTTFGKGSVQTVIPLRGGQDGALKLTTARYYTPSGGSIQKTGITPDLTVANSKRQAEAVYDDAVQFSEASLKGALDSQEGKVRRIPAAIEIPPDSMDVYKIALAARAPKKIGAASTGAAAAAGAPDDEDELTDAPPPNLAAALKPSAKTDFQLARALQVLQAGSVAEAEKLYPAKIYSKPKPAFITASVAPGAAKAGGPIAPSASATTAALPKAAPAEKVGPNQPAPAVKVPSR